MARNRSNILGALLILILTIVCCAYFFKSDLRRFYGNYRSARASTIYLESQITKYDVHGIDVSHHQGNIDWSDVKHPDSTKQINFAFIRASVGLDKDKKFNRNWIKARKAGITTGAYHYYWANVNSAKQASMFTSQVSLKKGDLPPVLDIEDTSSVQDNASLRKGLKNWIKIVEAHYGVKPIIYTGQSYFEDYLAPDDYFKDYPRLWIANYNFVDEPDVIDWDFWQYSDRIPVSGIETLVDGNVFKGNDVAFKNLLIR